MKRNAGVTLYAEQQRDSPVGERGPKRNSNRRGRPIHLWKRFLARDGRAVQVDSIKTRVESAYGVSA